MALIVVILPLRAQINMDFTVSEEVCLGAEIQLTNTSIGNQYEWDFCPNDMESTPSQSTLATVSGMSQNYGFDLVYDGQWYGFATDRVNNIIFRLNYGNSPENVPTIDTLGNPGGFLNAPEGLSLINSNGEWYCFIGYGNNGGNIVRLDFGSSLNNTPTAVNFGNYGVFAGRIRDLVPIQQGDSLFLVFPYYNANQLVVIKYRDSFDNTINSEHIITHSLSGSSLPRGLGMHIKDSIIYAFVANEGNSSVQQYNFGNDILNVPSLDSTYSFSTLDKPYRVSVTESNSKVYVFISNQNKPPTIVNLKDLDPASLGEEKSNAGFPNYIGLKSVKAGGDVFLHGIYGTSLIQNKYQSNCDASLSFSTDSVPSGISFSSSGIRVIELLVRDTINNYISGIDSVTIKSDVAPDINFALDSNRCIVNSNTFTSSSSTPGDIVSYQWIFGNDTLGSSNNPDTIYHISSPGLVDVALKIVSGAGCENQVSKQITMYSKPPSPSFSIVGTLCSGTELDFQNTTNETGFGAVLSYQWNFSNEAVISAHDTTYSFGTEGAKFVSLMVALPGCTDTTTQNITLNTGPDVDFNWTNNCFGEPVQFQNQSSGSGITDYDWSFGDGDTSQQENPTHLFSVADTFLISFIVTNNLGCETTKQKSIVVNDDPLVGIVSGDAIENLPVQFLGQDLTPPSDTIESWFWDLASLGISSQQDTTFTFASPGVYSITLSVITEQGCVGDTTINLDVDKADFPIAYFDSPDFACLEEPLSFFNGSVNVDTYDWDFCVEDMSEEVDVEMLSTVNGIGQSYGFELVKDGSNWYAFITDRVNNKIFRVYYGTSLINSTPQIDDLGNPGGVLVAPEGLDIKKINDNWIGFVGYGNNGDRLVRLEFGNSLANSPSAYVLGDFGFGTGRIRDVEIAVESDSLYLVFPYYNGNQLVILNYRDSFQNSISGEHVYTYNIANTNLPRGISIRRERTKWRILLVDEGNQVQNILIEGSLKNAPVLLGTYTFPSLNKPYRVSSVRSGANVYAFISNQSGSLSLLNMKDLDPVNAPSELDNTSLPNFIGVDAIKHKGVVYIQGLENSALSVCKYERNCNISESWTDSTGVSNILYSSSGSYPIELRCYNSTGVMDHFCDTITVTSSIAPSITFTPDSSRCLSNTNTFTSTIISGNITSYSWDFDGDQVEDSTDPSPTFQYLTPGAYDVRLDVVSDQGCSNFVEDQITMYPEPPTPVFDAVSTTTYCVGSEIVMDNQTIDTTFNGAISYNWSLPELGDTTTTSDLSATFQNPGEKVISVFSSIPGCESPVAYDTLFITPSPSVAFTGLTVCEGEVTTFTNSYESTEYLWSFGDGFTSTLKDPAHLYAQSGQYNVTLSSTNDEGCTSSLQKEIVVSAIPDPGFEYSLLCEGGSTVLRDVSIVDNSNVVAWEWYLEDQLISQAQSPEVTFSVGGNKLLKLVVYADNGCQASYSEEVEVLPQPTLSLDIEAACLGDNSLFFDKTINEGTILSRSWLVDGKLQTGSESTMEYQFSEPGDHEVMLIVDNENLCTGSTTQIITIPESPVLDFEVSGDCATDLVLALDLSTSSTDQVLSRKWYVDGQFVGNGVQSLLPVPSGGEYEVTLLSTTAYGCQVEMTKQIAIAAGPVVAFEASNDYGVPPFTLSFANQTQHATTYKWLIDGVEASSAVEPKLSFTGPGDIEVKLVAENENGCVDSSSTTILSVFPEIDLALNEIQLSESKGYQQIMMDVSNHSNLPMEHIQAVITLENDFQITENIYERMEAGEDKTITLNVGLPISNNTINYLCAALSSTYQMEDLNPLNDENCVNIEPQLVVEEVFPNPATEFAVLKVIMPEGGEAELSIVDIAGNIHFVKRMQGRPPGLNLFTYDLKRLDAGTYFLRFMHKGDVHNSRIIKQ